jgi:arylsulfatase A-like enzyme
MTDKRPNDKRPNVLLIMTDQQRADGVSAAGNPGIQTPNMDRIAKEGVLFSNAFCPNPFCMPSRASAMTGRYAHGHRCWDNGVPLPENTVTLATRLAEEGYHTRLIGKGHLDVFRRRGSPESWEDWLEETPRWADWSGPYYGFNEVRFAVGHNRPLGHYGMFLRERFPDAVKRFGPDSALAPPSGAPKSWKSGVPVEAHSSTWVGDQSVEFLDRIGDRPFFAWVSFPDPHPPFCPPAPYCDRYDPKDVPLPFQSEGELEDKPPHFKEFYEGRLVSGWGLNAFGEEDRASPDLREMTEDQYREIIAHYYGMISLIDDNVGKILRALDEKGLAEDTLVVFTSDHGDLLGDHFLIRKGAFHYDSLIRVPLLWRFPGRIAAGSKVEGQASLIDIVPTICDLLGVDPLPDVHGMSLAPELKGERSEGRENVLVEFDWRFRRGMPLKTLRTRDWKLTYYAGQSFGELYDLENDPHEVVNLYGKPEYAEVQRSMMKRLMDELILTEGYLPEQIAPH